MYIEHYPILHIPYFALSTPNTVSLTPLAHSTRSPTSGVLEHKYPASLPRLHKLQYCYIIQFSLVHAKRYIVVDHSYCIDTDSHLATVPQRNCTLSIGCPRNNKLCICLLCIICQTTQCFHCSKDLECLFDFRMALFHEYVDSIGRKVTVQTSRPLPIVPGCNKSH